MARSMMSAPASMAAIRQLPALPAVKWVWNSMGISAPTTSRAALTVSKTIFGVLVPEASLKQTLSKGMPASMIFLRVST